MEAPLPQQISVNNREVLERLFRSDAYFPRIGTIRYDLFPDPTISPQNASTCTRPDPEFLNGRNHMLYHEESCRPPPPIARRAVHRQRAPQTAKKRFHATFRESPRRTSLRCESPGLLRGSYRESHKSCLEDHDSTSFQITLPMRNKVTYFTHILFFTYISTIVPATHD